VWDGCFGSCEESFDREISCRRSWGMRNDILSSAKKDFTCSSSLDGDGHLAISQDFCMIMIRVKDDTRTEYGWGIRLRVRGHDKG
jgi:hypothetical protein